MAYWSQALGCNQKVAGSNPDKIGLDCNGLMFRPRGGYGSHSLAPRKLGIIAGQEFNI